MFEAYRNSIKLGTTVLSVCGLPLPGPLVTCYRSGSEILAPTVLSARQSTPPRAFAIVGYSALGKDYLGNVSENHGHSG